MTPRISLVPRGTPAGWRAGLIGVGLLFAGFNTGNNLLYLLFAVLASCEVAGSCLAGWVLRRIDAETLVPRRARAGASMRATVRLTNRSRRLALPPLEWTLTASGGEKAVVRTPPLRPGESGSASARLIPRARGWLRIVSTEVSSDYPLGLSRRVGRLESHDHQAAEVAPARDTRPAARGVPAVLVTPRPMPGRAHLTGPRRGDVRRLFRPKGPGEEPVDAREYRPGDDARKMDWKASARTERLIWRDRRGDPPRAIRVRLDRSGAEGSGFERRVSRAAGAVIEALGSGEAVGFVSDEVEFLPRSTPAQRRRILDYLATVRPAGGGGAA